MPATRSSARLATNAVQRINIATGSNAAAESQVSTLRHTKRNASTADEINSETKTKKRARRATVTTTTVEQSNATTVADGQSAILPVAGNTDTPVPVVLTFSLDEAKQHLVNVDRRFEDIFSKMTCKPYENLERFHPFQALSTSILGQQISWLAARSIIHKFKRLYDPSLPEKPGETPSNSFPSPAQVVATDLMTLKSAGLSTRKAEYVQDLAKRFADGRLSTQKILSANDEELAEMLIAVRGIGRWTVDMFAIFSLRRPDILPVGDLGVQRGLARWFLALHSPSDPCSISPEKVNRSTNKTKAESNRLGGDDSDGDGGDDQLPVLGESTSNHLDPDRSVVGQEVDGPNGLPEPFTPSIRKTLKKPGGTQVQPLPGGLSVTELRSRLSGKKKIKGAILTPQEMESLTEQWKPYRSIGVYYMWSLAASVAE